MNTFNIIKLKPITPAVSNANLQPIIPYNSLNSINPIQIPPYVPLQPFNSLNAIKPIEMPGYENLHRIPTQNSIDSKGKIIFF